MPANFTTEFLKVVAAKADLGKRNDVDVKIISAVEDCIDAATDGLDDPKVSVNVQQVEASHLIVICNVLKKPADGWPEDAKKS